MNGSGQFADGKFLVETVKRAAMLETLRDRPLDTRDLEETLPMSRSTVHRATQSLEEMGVLRRVEDGFALTGLGHVVADETSAYRTRLETARRLDEFLNVVEPSDVDVPLEPFADAEITRPQPRQAHNAVKRITELIEESESLRMFSSIISPLYVDVAHREMMNGMEIEVVFDTSVVEIILSNYAEEAIEALETGLFSIYVSHEVPFELFIYDDKMAMAAHDDSAVARMLVESGTPGAIEWADEIYRRYYERAWEFDAERLTRSRLNELAEG